MKKTINKWERVFFDGLTLLVPIAISFYILLKFGAAISNVLAPLATHWGIERLFGKLTLSLFAFILLVIIILLLGLIVRFTSISKFSHYLEEMVSKVFPPLRQIKAILTEKLRMEATTMDWQPVILKEENKFYPAFLVEVNDLHVIFFVIKGTHVYEGETLVMQKDDAIYKKIHPSELRAWVKNNGKGAFSLIADMH